jgi:amino acid adenylation domain-containing protein
MTLAHEAGLSNNIEQLWDAQAGKNGRKRVFSCLGDLLAGYGRTAPDHTAILGPGRSPVTYGALWAHAENAVRELRNLGVGRSDRVAVVLPNGPETAVAMVAVAAGAVCMPLNPSFTTDEWQRHFGDLRVTALLTRADMGSASRGVAHTLGIPIIDLLPQPNKGAGAFRPAGSALRRVSADGLASYTDDAFILLTSGTTSRPKTVPLTHASVCQSAYNAGAVLALGPRDRLLNVLPLYHAHGLISGLLTALAAGSSVVCTSGFDAAAFFGWLKEFRPTWYTAVPTIHRAVLSAAGPRENSGQRCSLRIIRSASSSLSPDVLGGLEATFGVPVVETYGMTEAASQIAASPVGRGKAGSVGVSAGAEIAIMDSYGRPLLGGERGEIALRGPTITRGYDNDAAATKAAFRDGWFHTGDLGYLDHEGYLFIVGRIKDIINRGGQKVAPAEIEETLLNHPDVVEAVAFPVSHRRLGEDIAAAVVLRKDAKVSMHKLRHFARERLARFKIPGLIRIVREIPKSPGGKIQRHALAAALGLPARSGRAERDVKMAPCGSDLEQELAKIWADLLETDQIGVNQDVYALGADSLTMTQMLSRLSTRFGIDFSFKDLFDAPTAAALAARIESGESNRVNGPLTLRDTPADPRKSRLSFQQQRIHLLSRLDPTGYNYQVMEVARLSGPLDVHALEASIAAISDRHELLRSTFPEQAGEPVQTLGTARPRLERLDIGRCNRSRRAAAIRRHAQELLRQPFDMETQPPLSARLLQLDEEDHALVIRSHHLVTDAWSQRLFWKELETLYRTRVNGASAELSDLPVQYRHFAEWQRAWLRTPAAEEQLSYWRSQLEGLTELPLRTDRPRPEKRTGRGARHPLKLSPALVRGINALSRAHRATPFMTLLAAFQCLLYRYTGHDDVAVGSLIANRNQVQTECLIGMFANTIVLRTDLAGDPSFSELLRRVRQMTLGAYRNQDLPIEEILRVLQVPRGMDRHALFQVMFILQNAAPKPPALSGLSVHFEDVDPGVARFDLTLELIDSGEGITGWLEYSTDLFEAATMDRMGAHFRTLLSAIIANPEERLSRLSLLPAEERRRVLFDWNQTDTAFGRFPSFPERFARQVERTPDALAVSAAQVRLSYWELGNRASAIADRLALEGVGPDIVVPLLAERTVNLLAAMIGVQQAGGAFLPLDPTFPVARLAQIIRHSRTPLVLAGEDCATMLEQALSEMPVRARPQVLNLDEISRATPRDLTPVVRPKPSSLAYVIYTSGSTGIPKGAMIEQRGLFNHLLSQISDLQLSPSDVVAQTAPQSFVISVWQFLAALMVGARVHVCSDKEVRDPALLVQEIAHEGVTVLQIVPALLREILERTPKEPAFRALDRLRWLISTGEAAVPDLCRDWLRHFPNVPVMNAYGSSECSDDVATHRLVAPPASLSTVSIGRPIANMRLYVLDAHLQPVPIGVTGELCVGGIGVGRGYFNDPEQTRRKFLRNPFSKRQPGRLYRTGDLGRRCADGTLEYLGRRDDQVKVRGYRIELNEIEHALVEHPDVHAAAVLTRRDLGGGTRLIAHIVAAAGRQPEVNALRDFLKTRLPGYMIPPGFIFLERIPLTAHGKVDRIALAGVRRELRLATNKFVPPRDATEKVLAEIWADLLEVKNVGVFDNFFDLGGHSLLAGQVLARVATSLRLSLPIRALFEAPTVEALARRIEGAREAQPNEPVLKITRVDGDGPQPVSMAQEHVLSIERQVPGLPQFNLPFAYRLQGPLNVRALERSLAEIVRRHDLLRTRFGRVEGRPVAVVEPPAAIESSFVMEDLAASRSIKSRRAGALLLKKAELEAEQEAWTSFDVTRAPLFRTRLLRLGADDYVLLLTLHHVIVDGWSIGILIEEISMLYAAFAADRRAQLPDPALRFSDFARWQRSWCTTDSAAQQFARWKELLRGASPVFSTARERADALLVSPITYEPIHLPNNLIARLSSVARRQGGTLFMALLTAFKALLLARKGHRDICVATAMANRSQQNMEGVIGPFENTTLIRTRIDSDLSFQDAFARVRDSVLEAYANQDLPFDVLSARLAEDMDVDPASITQVFFVLTNAFRRLLELTDVAVRPLTNGFREGQPVLPIDLTWLTVMLKATPSGVIGSCNYKTSLFEAGAVQHWLADYKTILAKAAANPGTSLGRLADH